MAGAVPTALRGKLTRAVHDKLMHLAEAGPSVVTIHHGVSYQRGSRSGHSQAISHHSEG